MNAMGAQFFLALIGVVVLALGFIWVPDEYDRNREHLRDRNRKKMMIARAFWLFGAVCALPAFLTLWNHAIFG